MVGQDVGHASEPPGIPRPTCKAHPRPGLADTRRIGSWGALSAVAASEPSITERRRDACRGRFPLTGKSRTPPPIAGSVTERSIADWPGGRCSALKQ